MENKMFEEMTVNEVLEVEGGSLTFIGTATVLVVLTIGHVVNKCMK